MHHWRVGFSMGLHSNWPARCQPDHRCRRDHHPCLQFPCRHHPRHLHPRGHHHRIPHHRHQSLRHPLPRFRHPLPRISCSMSTMPAHHLHRHCRLPRLEPPRPSLTGTQYELPMHSLTKSHSREATPCSQATVRPSFSSQWAAAASLRALLHLLPSRVVCLMPPSR